MDANETDPALPAAKPNAATSSDNEWNAVLRTAGGSAVREFNTKLLNDVAQCVRVQGDPSDDRDGGKGRTTAVTVTATSMIALAPKDEIEGMIAAQAVALHNAAMECFRRAMLPEQPSEIASRLRKDAANMARAMTDMLEALDRKRGKRTQQVVRVERVIVHEGAQAIVGNVTASASPRLAGAPTMLPDGEGAVEIESLVDLRKTGGWG